ncbi:MAG: ATP-binding protein, partial [Parvibaculum sp.]
ARMPSATMKVIDINEVLRQSVFLQRVGHSDIDYVLELPDETVMLECDGRLVSQALTNVLKNAAEAVRRVGEEEGEEGREPQGKPGEKVGRIHIRLSADEENVIIMATDSGCGLPEADRSRLTEPYMTTRAKGTGLGLAIVNKVMEDHSGKLILEDAPADEGWESGARVRLIFPRQRGADEFANDKNGSAERAAGRIGKEAVNGV